MAETPRRWRSLLSMALCILLLDQASKLAILHLVMDPPRIIEVTGFFNLVLTYNRGVSFGLLQQDSALGVWLLAIAAVAIGSGVAIWALLQRRLLLALAGGAVLGGAIGNVIDRVAYGAVVDFLDFHAFGWHWPAFNVADSAVVLGVFTIVFDGLRKPAGDAT